MKGSCTNRGALSGLILLALGLHLPSSGTEPVRILPLGDSITHGYYSGVSVYNSYRKELKNLLDGGGFDTDFSGSLEDGDFPDNQHEGHDGWFADDDTSTNTIISHVMTWMAGSEADVVLLHVGTNDIIEHGAHAAEVSGILDEIFTANSNATVVLALIISVADNYKNLGPDISAFNSNVNAMAQMRIANGDDIIVVDMENGAGIDYTSSDMASAYHPSQIGYDKMATNWFPAVTNAIIRQRAPHVPRIASITVESNAVSLYISNLTSGTTVDVERASSLTDPDWAHLASITATTSSISWHGPAETTNSHFFYRASAP